MYFIFWNCTWMGLSCWRKSSFSFTIAHKIVHKFKLIFSRITLESVHFSNAFFKFRLLYSIIKIIFSNLNPNCPNLLDMRNLQEQVKKAFCYQKLFWSITVWINCSSELKNFANLWPSALNFKSFSWSPEQFLTDLKFNCKNLL